MIKPRRTSKADQDPAVQAGRDVVLPIGQATHGSPPAPFRDAGEASPLRAWVRRYVTAVVQQDAAARAGADNAIGEGDTR